MRVPSADNVSDGYTKSLDYGEWKNVGMKSTDHLATTWMHGKWDQGPLGRIDSDGEIAAPAERQAHQRKTVVDKALQELRTAGIDIDQ